jgi:hypothetical protein
MHAELEQAGPGRAAAVARASVLAERTASPRAVTKA